MVRVTSGGTSYPRAKSASSRPKLTGRPDISARCPATRSSSSRCRRNDRTSLLRQIEPDVQLLELLGCHLRWSPHQKVFGALVHREQHDLAQVLFTGQQHDNAVDAGSDAAVRRRAE